MFKPAQFREWDRRILRKEIRWWLEMLVVAVYWRGGGQTERDGAPQAFPDNRTRIVTTLRQTSKNPPMRSLPSEIEH